MNTMKAMVLASTLTLFAIDSVRAQDRPAENDEAGWEQQVRAAEARHVQTALVNDVAAWDALLADDFVVNSPLNSIVEKSELLDFIRRGVLSASSFEQRIELVRRFGEIAVVMGEDIVVWEPPSPNAGQTHHRRFTDIWRLVEGEWRFVARQATLVSK